MSDVETNVKVNSSNEVKVPAKPGYKTSEFYFIVAANILTLAFASGIIETGSRWDQMLGLVGNVLTNLGYAVVRGQVKK